MATYNNQLRRLRLSDSLAMAMAAAMGTAMGTVMVAANWF